MRELGIKVVFEKEKIDTFDPSAEVYLTIAAAVAENDLKIYSENQKWAIREKFSKGYISVGSQILGYRMNKETNTPEAVTDEAETVKMIYSLYLSGLGLVGTARKLTELGRKNVMGKVRWDRGSVRYILTNEKYTGCTLSQKTVTNLGDCRVNKNAAKQYYIENSHEALIDKEIFNKVRHTMYARAPKALINKQQPVYPFSHMVSCGVCGGGYSHKIQNPNKAWAVGVWVCQKANFYGQKACCNTRIKDSVLREKFIECYNEFILQNYVSCEADKLHDKLNKLLAQGQELNALRINRLINSDDYKSEHRSILSEIEKIKTELDEYKVRSLTKKDYTPITEFSEEKAAKFITKVTVKQNTVTFVFINGVKISRPYTNGTPGNSKGWLNRKENKYGNQNRR